MDPKMEEALSKWWDEPRPPDGFHWSADKRSFRAGYKAALADNAELVRQHKLDADTAIDSLREAEEQLAEARATIELAQAFCPPPGYEATVRCVALMRAALHPDETHEPDILTQVARYRETLVSKP